MEVTLIKAQEATMTRLLHGLNRDIQDIVELHEYTSLSTLVHQASKVELQLKRHGKRTYPTTSSNWKGKESREDKLLKRDKSPKNGSVPFKSQNDEVNKVSIPNFNASKLSNINESSQEETSTSGSKGGYSCEEAPYKGDLLIVRRLMSTFIEEDQSQRENIFHSRYLIQGKYCSLIIDGGSSVNVTSQRLVEYFVFLLFPILNPINFSGLYQFPSQWACTKMKFFVISSSLVKKTMEYDRKVTHDGVTNKLSFMHEGNKTRKRKRKKKERKSREKKGEKNKENKENKVKKNKSEHESLLVEPLLFLPTNMCLMMNSPLNNLLATFEKMLKEFKDIFPKEMPHGLPHIRGIEH
ncbi:hypothetical protein CR513_02534, partial [Mucuna pruriens]